MEFSISNIDIKSIFKDLLRNLPIILLAGITALLSIFSVYTFTYKPEYKSVATLCVNMKNDNGSVYSSLYLTKEMTTVFTEVFESDSLKKIITEDLGVDEIEGKMIFNIIEETNLFTLEVVSDTPKNSFNIINSALKNYSTISDYMFTNANIEILKAPTIPLTPSNSLNLKKVCLIGFLCAILLSSLIVIVISFFRPTVKNLNDAKNKLDGNILGTIPYVKKYKTRREYISEKFKKDFKKNALLITSSRVGMPFVESIKKISTIVEHRMKHKNEKVLLITSAMENEGKSSIVANIALSIAEKDKKVLIIDADLRKPAISKIFEKKNDSYNSVSDFLSGKSEKFSVVHYKKENIYCIPQYRGIKNSSTLLKSKKIKELIDICRTQFDYIIIDTSPLGVVTDAEILLQNSDAVLLAVREDHSPVGVINDIADIIGEYNIDFMGFILNADESKFSYKKSNNK